MCLITHSKILTSKFASAILYRSNYNEFINVFKTKIHPSRVLHLGLAFKLYFTCNYICDCNFHDFLSMPVLFSVHTYPACNPRSRTSCKFYLFYVIFWPVKFFASPYRGRKSRHRISFRGRPTVLSAGFMALVIGVGDLLGINSSNASND